MLQRGRHLSLLVFLMVSFILLLSLKQVKCWLLFVFVHYSKVRLALSPFSSLPLLPQALSKHLTYQRFWTWEQLRGSLGVRSAVRLRDVRIHVIEDHRHSGLSPASQRTGRQGQGLDAVLFPGIPETDLPSGAPISEKGSPVYPAAKSETRAPF